MQKNIVPGQRWASDSEPELGLGIVETFDGDRILIHFPAANERRNYAIASAPIRRVRLRVGDAVRTTKGEEAVTDVNDDAGLLYYTVGDEVLCETAISATQISGSPIDRLLNGQVDPLDSYLLRIAALDWQARIRSSSVRGFVGGRIDLIPHQLHIASEISSRLVPRVLLADEVGLGKTIEACLILKRLHVTGRASRILVLLPEPLVHQWFVELLRRFNLMFSLYDETRCSAIREENPFLDEQMVIAPINWLAESELRTRQVAAAEWDLLVVDEAHHLVAESKATGLVASLSRVVPGLLLLTGTPHQLGLENHFARLQLLDPRRYSDFKAFTAEARHYETIAKQADEWLSRGANVDELLDRFGTGRVMFRNTRAVLGGFPQRKAELYPLDGEPFAARIEWLVGLVGRREDEKILLICSTRKLAEEISVALQERVRVKSALFHEGLNLMQRDRNAAFFADPDGARILISSEIGSEGRNFQFARHLVLFDLPRNPELLEQRIGRLDRIGQKGTIRIHVPFVQRTEGEVLARWYQDGLDAFEENLHGGAEIAALLAEDLGKVMEDPKPARVSILIRKSKTVAAKVRKRLASGYDRLLALNSSRSEATSALIAAIKKWDDNPTFEEFVVTLLDHLGVEVIDLGGRDYLLRPDHLLVQALPGLPDTGLSGTFDRRRALGREDLSFLTADHPLLRGALDAFVGGPGGTASIAVSSEGEPGLVAQVWFIAECVAPTDLHIDRFFPPQPIQVAIRPDLAEADPVERPGNELVPATPAQIQICQDVLESILPDMLEAAEVIAQNRLETSMKLALDAMEAHLGAEIDRLQYLSTVNDHVTPAEVEAMRSHREVLRSVLATPRLRVDAIGIVIQGSASEQEDVW